MLFRKLAWSWPVLFLGCGDTSTGPTLPSDESEVPHTSYELLVESVSRSGARSFSTMAPDGTRVLGFAGLPVDARSPTPSPDGRSVAFLQPTIEGNLHLWIMDRQTGATWLLLGGTRLVDSVAWSPDGRKLVVTGSTFEEADGIWVLDADGSNLVPIATDPKPATVADRSPTWSADGQFIAFQSNRSGIFRLWIMDANGANPRMVMPNRDETELGPAWSLDGTRIAFIDPTVGVGLVAPDGTGYRAIALPRQPSNLTWTPDGMLLYSASNGLDAEIFALDPANGTSENLTRHPDHDLRAVVLPWEEPSPWLGLDAARWVASGQAAPVRIVVGDVTADGMPDALVLDEFDDVVVLRGTAGMLESFGTLEASHAVIDAAVADVSRDGIDDLVLLAADAIVVWRGGVSGPGPATTHPLGGSARGLAVHDFDRDGSADLAGVYDGGENGFRMLVHSVSTADGSLVAVLDYPSTFSLPGGATAGDVDADGRGDVVVLTSRPEEPVVLVPGHGDISFGLAAVAATAISVDAAAVPLCADLNGDRRDDLVLIGSTGSDGVRILRSLGTTFASPTRLDVEATALVAGDVDRDGDVDLVAAVAGSPRVVFLRNRGNGDFAGPVDLIRDRDVVDLDLRDLDGDAWLDLVMLGRDGNVGVAMNQGR